MTRNITSACSPATGDVDEAFAEVRAASVGSALPQASMMEADVTAACGPRNGRDTARRALRW